MFLSNPLINKNHQTLHLRKVGFCVKLIGLFKQKRNKNTQIFPIKQSLEYARFGSMYGCHVIQRNDDVRLDQLIIHKGNCSIEKRKEFMLRGKRHKIRFFAKIALFLIAMYPS